MTSKSEAKRIASHTTGPWMWEVEDGDIVVSQPGSDGQVICIFRDAEHSMEWQSDAMLIAAAPKLLEALCEMTALAKGPKAGVTVADKKRVIALADAAIFAATGTQP